MIGAALRQREADGRRVKVAVVGAGRFGASVIAQIAGMPGMDVAAIAERSPVNMAAAWEAYGAAPDEAVTANEVGRAVDAVKAGRPVALEDADITPDLPVDVIVEATGVTEVSARICRAALERGKHVVNVTVEADVAVGARLAQIAGENGVVYTLADGDQPGVANRLVDWARSLGFQVIAAGRGTRRYPADREGSPKEAFARYRYSAEMVARRRLNAQMYNSFRDGTKSQLEMCALANVAGLVPDRPGMHEPPAGIDDLARLFRLRKDGGILGREGVVELANAVAEDGETDVAGEIANGVFVVIRSPHPLIAEDLGFYGLKVSEDGRTGVIYRPYHLCGVEAPLSAAEAALFGHATACPRQEPVADVAAVAKRDLAAGSRLDGSGGTTVSGYVVGWGAARARGILPLALAEGVKLLQPVERGRAIRYADVQRGRAGTIEELRHEMGDRGWEGLGAEVGSPEIEFPV